MQIPQTKNPHLLGHHYFKLMIWMFHILDILCYLINWLIPQDSSRYYYQLKYNFIASTGTTTKHHLNSSFNNLSRWLNILDHWNLSSKKLSKSNNHNHNHNAKHNSHNHWLLYLKEEKPCTKYELLNQNISVKKNDEYH